MHTKEQHSKQTKPIENDCFLRALNRQPVDRTPIWVMRQAGRYLPEYLKVRAQAGSFMNLCRTPELAAEVTLQPVNRFALDASIVFSDILVVADVMGCDLHFVEGEGPQMRKPIRSAADLKACVQPDVQETLSYVMDTIRLVKQGLNQRVPLIGFSGSPWTVACYAVEGSGSREFSVIKSMLYRDPALLHSILAAIQKVTAEYLLAQVEAGVDVLMIFDTWGSLLSPTLYQHFDLHYVRPIIAAIKAKAPHIPVIFFTKGGGLWLETQADLGCAALGLDWTVSLKDARARVGNRVALQGNLDPSALLGSPESIEQAVQAVLADFGPGNGHIFNLGHGIQKETPPEHLQHCIEAVHRYSPAYHQGV